jgi:two-component system chemotaxis sensor kinase CheA
LNIVVLRAEDHQFGLVVDRINDTEEIVVKPLSKQLKGIPVYSGTTIMGDGKVALILDVHGLAQCSNVLSKERDRRHPETIDRNSQQACSSKTLLVLGVGESQRYALLLSEVTRLERIPRKSIEIADHREVVQYRGEILPLIRLSEYMKLESFHQDSELLDVVVYSEQGRSVGIIVDRIIDIVETRLEITRRGLRSGLIGSAVIQDHVTDILELSKIIHATGPAFSDHGSTESSIII